MHPIIHSLRSRPRLLFLVDACGALLTLALIWLLLVPFESFFGMPRQVLSQLSVPAGAMACYSFCCYWLQPKAWAKWLRVIMMANIIYCILTALAMLFYADRLTLFGYLYFAGELALILALAKLEYDAARLAGASG